MSIFAMNYLFDISQYDQSITNLNQTQVTKLREKTKKTKQFHRVNRNQSFNRSLQNVLKQNLKVEQDRIMEEALKCFDFQLGNYKDNQKSKQNQQKIEDYSLNQNQINVIRQFQRPEGAIQNIRQKVYLQVIQKRHEKLKKVEKRNYFSYDLDF